MNDKAASFLVVLAIVLMIVAIVVPIVTQKPVAQPYACCNEASRMCPLRKPLR